MPGSTCVIAAMDASGAVLYATLAICVLLGGLLVYRYDMYEKEPWYMLVAAAALGAIAMAPMGVIEDASISLLGRHGPTPLGIGVVAASHEEAAKLLIVVAIAVLVPRQFNDPMDGIVYGSVAGLGMAMTESIFYLNLWTVTGPLLPPTEVVRLLGHLVMGGISGFGVGLARLRLPGWRSTLLVCFAASVTLHTLWDWLALTTARAGAMRPWQTVASVGLMLGGITLYGVLVVRGSELSRRLFAPGSKRSLWGWPFSLLLRRSGRR